MRQRGKPALGLGVVMAKGANILAFGESVKAATDDFMADGAAGHRHRAGRRPAEGRRPRDPSSSSARSSRRSASCSLVSFLSLGWRTGIVVALSVPLVLAITFAVMSVLGIDLHRITLGALIIALGLLVDDAIIAVEMMVVKIEQGWDRMRAAAFAWTSTAFPMLTGTLVTAAGFLPIGFANSAVGEYAGGIFWVVAIALVASWFVAVIFTPYLGVKLLPQSLARHAHADPHAIYETRLYRGLRRVVQACVDRRGLTVLATVAHLRRLDRRLRPRAAAVLPALRAAGAVLPDAPARGHGDRRHARDGAAGRERCSATIPTSSPTRPISARARRASGSASTRSCRTRPSPRS